MADPDDAGRTTQDGTSSSALRGPSFVVRSDSSPCHPYDELVEQRQREIDLGVADVEQGREGNDVLVVAADIEHEAVAPAIVVEIALERFLDHAIDDRPVRREPCPAPNSPPHPSA